VADWLGYPRALLFGNRYMADLAVVQALLANRTMSACRTASTIRA
jgi:7-keto-8-aminopelargonate synthetase-like enzyme